MRVSQGFVEKRGRRREAGHGNSSVTARLLEGQVTCTLVLLPFASRTWLGEKRACVRTLDPVYAFSLQKTLCASPFSHRFSPTFAYRGKPREEYPTERPSVAAPATCTPRGLYEMHACIF